MCYEYWRNQLKRSEKGDEARKRMQEIIEKAKNAQPAPRAGTPSEAGREKETVPA